MHDTIYAVSSGAPPAAIGIVRVSGPQASACITALAGMLPPPRRASLRTLRKTDGQMLDQALVLWFPGPATATGEDLAEFHCHGGRAVLSAVEEALGQIPACRLAEPGEFTRRAFANEVIDLAQAEGLSDLLAAETELQRQAALDAASGTLSGQFETWRAHLLGLAAQVEAVLDFEDEDDVAPLGPEFFEAVTQLETEWRAALALPRAQRLRKGLRVVLAGPPNAGKSSLFNAILDEGAAIVSAEAGTTRDVIERPIALGGVPFVLVDTAGMRGDGAGDIERIGIAKAKRELERADIILWLGESSSSPSGAWDIESFADLGSRRKDRPRHIVSSETKAGVAELITDLIASGKSLLPKSGAIGLQDRQARDLVQAADCLADIEPLHDQIVIGETLRRARHALDRLTGRVSTEEVLDTLFGRFCIGK